MRTTFAEMKASFTAPTKWEYVKFLLTIPTWDDAYTWSNLRMSGGPMNEEEYSRYMDLTDDHDWNVENADSINRSRSLTTVGWYLYLWYNTITTPFKLSYREFIANEFEDHCNKISYDEDSY